MERRWFNVITSFSFRSLFFGLKGGGPWLCPITRRYAEWMLLMRVCKVLPIDRVILIRSLKRLGGKGGLAISDGMSKDIGFRLAFASLSLVLPRNSKKLSSIRSNVKSRRKAAWAFSAASL